MNRRSGEELLAGSGEAAPLALVYRGGERVSVEAGSFGQTSVRSLSATRAEVVIAGWDGDGVIGISGDPETGDLVVEPGASSSRPDVRACRCTAMTAPRSRERNASRPRTDPVPVR